MVYIYISVAEAAKATQRRCLHKSEGGREGRRPRKKERKATQNGAVLGGVCFGR